VAAPDPSHLSPEASAALAAGSAALAALEAPPQETSPAAEKTPATPESAATNGLIADVAPPPAWRGGLVIRIVLLGLISPARPAPAGCSANPWRAR
jgi:hypothetical protein